MTRNTVLGGGSLARSLKKQMTAALKKSTAVTPGEGGESNFQSCIIIFKIPNIQQKIIRHRNKTGNTATGKK